MSAAAQIDTAELIEFIPLNQLVLSEHNMRTDNSDPTADAMLEASLESYGVLQNLIVHKAGRKFGVAGGGRRLRLLQGLVKEKRIAAGYEVPCRILDLEHALAASLAENTTRLDAHPADEFVTYAGLSDQGKSVKEIALMFGVSELYVRQRLALAKVAPKLLEYYRKNDLSIEAIQAYSSEPDQKRQLKIYKSLGSWAKKNPREIREAIRGQGVRSDDMLARFVTVEAYKAAGGQVTANDLFDGDVTLNNHELLQQLADEKLQKKVDSLKAEGFAWVCTDPDKYWRYRFDYQRHTGKLTKEQKAASGAHVHLSSDGKIETLRGLYQEKQSKSRTNTASHDGLEYSQALRIELGNMREEAFRAHLASVANSANVYRYFHFALVDKVFGPTLISGGLGFVDVRIGTDWTECRSDACYRAVEDIEYSDSDDPLDRWNHFCELSNEHQHRLIQAAMAATFRMGLHSDHFPLLNHWIGAQHPQWTDHFQLTFDNYFNRVKIPTLEAIVLEVLGDSRLADLSKLTKKKLAEFLHQLFNEEEAWKAEGLEDRPVHLPQGFTAEVKK